MEHNREAFVISLMLVGLFSFLVITSKDHPQSPKPDNFEIIGAACYQSIKDRFHQCYEPWYSDIFITAIEIDQGRGKSPHYAFYAEAIFWLSDDWIITSYSDYGYTPEQAFSRALNAIPSDIETKIPQVKPQANAPQ